MGRVHARGPGDAVRGVRPGSPPVPVEFTMSSGSCLRAASAAGLLLFAVACGHETTTEPLLPLEVAPPTGIDATPAEPLGNAVELLINIHSPPATGNPPSYSLSTLPTTVEAGTTWSRTIAIDPNHPAAPQVAVDYGDGSEPKSVSVSQSGGPVWGFVDGVLQIISNEPYTYSFTLGHKYTAAGIYTVRVAAETFGEDSGTRIESRAINVTPDLNLHITDFQISSPVKAGWPATITFGAQGPGEGLYTWTANYGEALTQQGFIPPGETRELTYTWKNPGTYALVVTISNGERSATLTRQVTVENSPITIENLYITPVVQEGEAVEYRFKVMGPGSGPYTIRIGTLHGEQIQRTASPGATLSGSLTLESGLYAMGVEVSAEGLETVGEGRFVTVQRPPPSIVDPQIPETAYVGEEVLISFLAADATQNATYKAYVVVQAPVGTPEEAWADHLVLQELFEGDAHPVEARLTFEAPGDHEVVILVGSEKNNLLSVDTLRAGIAVLELTCEPGSYKAGYTCVDAPAGSYVPDAGAEQATPCPAGTYQNQTGQTSCIPAPAGTFVAVAGSAQATACSAGTYQPEAGQTHCIAAPIGTYVDVTGATAATSCPALTTTAGTGATSAADCRPVGTVVADRIDDAVRTGGLVPAESGRPGQQQFSSWVLDVKRSLQFLEGPQRQAGCVGLRNTLARADGQPSPKDVVTGPSLAAMAAELRAAMAAYGCSTGG